MKIVVIGAGIGGLQAAALLSGNGEDVTVYERNSLDNLCYDWIDDVEPTVFGDLGIPLPEGYFRTASPTFCPPFSDDLLSVTVPEEKREWSIERRAFSTLLAERDQNAGAELKFSTPVDALYFVDGKVNGVVVDGKAIEADLVIDSSGVNSPFRASLPDEYHVTKYAKPEEKFVVYRAFFDSAKGVTTPTEDTKKIYLKHLGEDGISWCFVEPNGETNILIGRIGELDEDTIRRSFSALREDNPIIGDNFMRGGIVTEIPVRYVISRMVGDGYAAIGDAAFMTVPMIGSGISNSLRAGKILAETVVNTHKTDTKTLWSYQWRYYQEVGAANVMVDSMKRMLLCSPWEDIRFLFSSGIIGKTEFNSIASGEELKLSFTDILDKARRGIKRLPILLSLVGAITRGQKMEKHARAIPQNYDAEAVLKWQNKLDSFLK